ncbi:NUDIX hydrolase [Kribbella flavida DSM 17836]|uniref:NUDIX hydrolase n=1 Tax=Kribbella flavida (strain DSM 17836 / JCM 10339 / NBRC 14399) TaxID=479435 RepID=D2PTN5_KRIFD|nr:NUDIX hydrolase [Kribbella flavida]ADB31348.1 NUDIX hydrolase [Kribbella flavida DSM 17836]
MQRYAGVVARYENQVALVREQYDAWGQPYWNLPSGAVEPRESPTAGAVRELREETGLRVAEHDLALIWTTTVICRQQTLSRSWNYAVEAPVPHFAVDDPDGSVLEVRWFPLEEAARLVRQVPYPPISVPAAAYLDDPATDPTPWTFARADDDGVQAWSSIDEGERG